MLNASDLTSQQNIIKLENLNYELAFMRQSRHGAQLWNVITGPDI
jgi:hypothetical protein